MEHGVLKWGRGLSDQNQMAEENLYMVAPGYAVLTMVC